MNKYIKCHACGSTEDDCGCPPKYNSHGYDLNKFVKFEQPPAPPIQAVAVDMDEISAEIFRQTYDEPPTGQGDINDAIREGAKLYDKHFGMDMAIPGTDRTVKMISKEYADRLEAELKLANEAMFAQADRARKGEARVKELEQQLAFAAGGGYNEIPILKDKIAALEAENAKVREEIYRKDKWVNKEIERLRSALTKIANSTKWGEDTAIKREITSLQAIAKDALGRATEE